MLRKLIDNEFECGRLVAGQQQLLEQVLPNYHIHRGSLSIRPWNKCGRISTVHALYYPVTTDQIAIFLTCVLAAPVRMDYTSRDTGIGFLCIPDSQAAK